MAKFTDTERLDFLEDVIFQKKWDGTLGRPPRWYAMGAASKLSGETLREAIDGWMENNNG